MRAFYTNGRSKDNSAVVIRERRWEQPARSEDRLEIGIQNLRPETASVENITPRANPEGGVDLRSGLARGKRVLSLAGRGAYDLGAERLLQRESAATRDELVDPVAFAG